MTSWRAWAAVAAAWTSGAVAQAGPASSDPVAARAVSILATQSSAGPAYAWESAGAGLAAGAFELDGPALVVRTGAWTTRLRTRAIGRGPSPRPWSAVPHVEPHAHVAAATHDGITERWIHGPLGVEHLYELGAAPAGEGPLVVELEISGLEPYADGAGEIALLDELGRVGARYGALYAYDADGRGLPSRFEIGVASVRLVVDDAGARYPVVIDPLVSTERAPLFASGGALEDHFGYAVAISTDGTRAIVGAYLDNVSGRVDAGTARVFRRNGTAWIEEATLEPSPSVTSRGFGGAVALSADGTTAIVGGYNTTIGGRTQTGSAEIFVRVGTVWTPQAVLDHSSAGSGDNFGYAVALSADGDRALVGAYQDDTVGANDGGSAFVYLRTGTAWSQEYQLVPAASEADDSAGASVALSADGTIAFVGVYNDDASGARDDAGSVVVFVRSGTTWAQQDVLFAGGGATGDAFGASVACSADGTTVVVGAPSDGVAGAAMAGSARVFTRSGTTWAEAPILLAPTGVANDRFGMSVALSSDGTTALVGEWQDDNAAGVDAGSAHAFIRVGPSWTDRAALVSAGGLAGDGAGISVALAGDGTLAFVGADMDDTTLDEVGSVAVYALARVDGTPCTAATQCGSGFCVDGVCCESACGGGSTTDCQACSAIAGGMSSGRCTPLAAAATVTCRPAVGPCDVAETCASASVVCPTDVLESAGVTCLPAAGPCDLSDVCSGTSAACPARFQPAGTMCGTSTGDPCDLPDVCDGVSAVCVATSAPPTTVCRDSRGACDRVEHCDGVSAACPADGFEPAGTECLPASSEPCDAADVCTGTSADCMPTFLAGTPCRPSAGACDAPEVCAGSAESCPPDDVASVGTVCRASSDATCDPAEACDGLASTCPVDVTTCEVPDAGAPHDAPVPGDAGAEPPVAADGCSCRLTPVDRAGAPVALAVASVALVRRRRRRPGA